MQMSRDVQLCSVIRSCATMQWVDINSDDENCQICRRITVIQNSRSRLAIPNWSSYTLKNSFSSRLQLSSWILIIQSKNSFFITKIPFLGSMKWPHTVCWGKFLIKSQKSDQRHPQHQRSYLRGPESP
jgi:hypothetical protein